ncbi:M1 family metallopeptidase [Nocardioides humilatus]|uniref:Aminopeptidase N n=1 Tax=Nocardioides humilatus TaxID=2607660 RepID=A0A5B1LDE4_9ACTN|nr:M1 family metallopeptidase [Nocardioides humilatus]KAA1418466.1 M1 family metallopeptidase [Nocardioides humilatus]
MLRRSRISTSTPLIALLLAVALTSPLASSAGAGPAPELPDPYYPADGAPGLDVLHYDVHDRYRFSDRFVSGVTTVRLKPDAEAASFSLDLLLKVDSVKVDGVEAEFDKPDAHELVITPADPLTASDPVDVTVRYHGFPQRISWQGESNWLADGHEVVTMNEPHMAAWWFPSNDHPSDKARFDIRITTGKDREVVSNGVRVERTVNGKRATTHWRMSDPMATYLAFFAAGDFVIEKGKAHGLRYYNAVSRQLGLADRQRALFALRKSAKVTAWLQDELGDYPFASTGGVVTSLDVGFALENQSRPTYGSWIYGGVVVHELAHQWFGDAVSVARWQDIWLNEGFATYMELRWTEAHGGRSTSASLHQQYRDSREDDSFWSLDIADPCAGQSPCDWRKLFASAVYERGSMALAALRNVIGTDDFRKLLRRWVSLHGGGNATVEEFEALAEEVSGDELDVFFQAWLSADTAPPNTAAYGL